MRYEIGKRYWRVKDDGGIYEFLIMKGIREARGVAEGKTYHIDTYYDEKDSKVLTDGINMPPSIMPPINAVIFDSEQKALEFLIERLDKRKRSLDQDEYVERMTNESGK